jgi:GNAT superfamily N-acetyltransferase
MLRGDIAEIVQVHLESFRAFFLTFLGPDFLSLLYLGIQGDPQGIVLVASCDGRIEGFVAGVEQQSGFYRRLIARDKWRFAFASVPALVRKPTLAPRLLRALRRPAEAQHASAQACLMSLAVRPAAEGQGIGRRLVRAFCRELAGRGVSAVCLTTDRDQNERVNRFYQKLGFELGTPFTTPEGRAMNEYVLDLVDQKEPSLTSRGNEGIST